MIYAAHEVACDRAVAHHWEMMKPYEVDEQTLRDALDPSKSQEQRLDEARDRAVAEYFDEHRAMPRPGTQLQDPVTRYTVTYEPRAQIEINRFLQQEQERCQQHVAARDGRLQPIADADFAAGDYKHNYLIQNVLIEGQPMMISGIKKALKTSTIVDMAASLASGKPFLGHHKFQVPKAVPVGVYSGESGKATIQDTRRRVYEAKTISGAQIYWCFEVPQFDSHVDIAAIVKNITDNKLQVVIFDPLYLSMCGIGDGASNMFKVGALLRPIAEACIKAGATPIFVHHNTKGNSKNYEPPELEDMAWAGFAEFARQWLLIGRRELYEIGSGVHKLWMNIGSSAGFNGCYGVDVEEGTADSELRGRRWQVSVMPQRDIITQKMQLRGEKNAQKACETQERLNRALTHFGCAGATMTEIEAYARMNKKKALDLLEHMVERQQVEKCQIRKRNGTFDGYRWKRDICPA